MVLPDNKGFTAHRPFVKYVAGNLINGITINDSVNMTILGVPGSGQASLPLYMEHDSGKYVYNNMNDSMDLAISGASGVNSVLNLYMPEGVSGSINSSPEFTLFTSGIGVSSENLNLRVRGK